MVKLSFRCTRRKAKKKVREIVKEGARLISEGEGRYAEKKNIVWRIKDKSEGKKNR